MAEDFTRVTVQIFAKPLVTHMVPIQEELIEWIALLHNLSPQINWFVGSTASWCPSTTRERSERVPS